jgi:thiamine phosphate synthase YjbQ (UPF0047 family)
MQDDASIVADGCTSDVRVDMSDALDRIVPEDKKGNLYRHSCEGPDDMPVSLTQRSPRHGADNPSGTR